MKTIDADVHFRLHYSMTREEAQLIFDVTDGYVALARTLTQEVSTRFPRPKEHYEKLFSSLREGMYEALKRCKDSDDVFDGTKVAVERKRLAHLEDLAKELAALKKAAALTERESIDVVNGTKGQEP